MPSAAADSPSPSASCEGGEHVRARAVGSRVLILRREALARRLRGASPGGRTRTSAPCWWAVPLPPGGGRLGNTMRPAGAR